MTARGLLAITLRVARSVLFAGVFYTGWMAVAIPTIKSGFGGLVVKVLLWIVAPAITGFGFALGPAVFDLLSPAAHEHSFWKTYKWSLVSCAIGGGVFCIFGPILIVFGMFTAGVLSIALQEMARITEECRI